MYEEIGPDGRRVHTVGQIAAEFGVTRPTVYRHLARLPVEQAVAAVPSIDTA
jgi:predicted ArsR family transcriptional regulator